MEKKQEGFSQLAITLLNHYDGAYYVDINTGEYTALVSLKGLKKLNAPYTGDDFYTDSVRFLSKCVHPNDLEIIKKNCDKKTIIEALSKSEVYSIIFRMIINENVVHMKRSLFLCPDRDHAICCLENIEEDFIKKETQKKNLESAERMARFDELTGVRNKNAFKEYSESIDDKIKSGEKNFSFGLILCDMNDLKLMNDTRGHNFGDEYIQRASRIICNIFTHSPVFRIGGDEFVVVLTGEDYENRRELLNLLIVESLENKKSRSGPVIAAGMAEYKAGSDKSFSKVFNRADKLMYKNKKELKSIFINRLGKDVGRIDVKITNERKRLLNALFEALCTVSDGGYLYLNDMRYDFSRWSLSLVTDFGMPSEYMYQADKLWNEHIHPDDLKAYRVAVDKIFSHSDACMIPLEYRARKADGTYVLLSTRGFVLSDKDGDPEYFGGIIVPL